MIVNFSPGNRSLVGFPGRSGYINLNKEVVSRYDTYKIQVEFGRMIFYLPIAVTHLFFKLTCPI